MHDATADEVESVLVAPFSSDVRRRIFNGWSLHRDALRSVCPFVEQYLDGSFVTSKEEPGDVDIITVIDIAAYDRLPDSQKMLVVSLVNGHHTREFWGCDSFPVFKVEPTDVRFAQASRVRDHWMHFFGHTRDGLEKGLVRVS
ncbi:MAG: hypothetical protein S0880_25970 [Actinomycetota bacterium]|nr:hypothetical protein [Actinomycetota bacterium]